MRVLDLSEFTKRTQFSFGIQELGCSIPPSTTTLPPRVEALEIFCYPQLRDLHARGIPISLTRHGLKFLKDLPVVEAELI